VHGLHQRAADASSTRRRNDADAPDPADALANAEVREADRLAVADGDP
jgi:hypothetical protein